ncbi:hypothetical protein COOONC_02771 [Cooperia oncophora]
MAQYVWCSAIEKQIHYTLLFSVGMPNSLSDRTHLAELRYLASVCDENVVILKMDDDVGWDVQRVSEFVRNNLTSHELYCSR